MRLRLVAIVLVACCSPLWSQSVTRTNVRAYPEVGVVAEVETGGLLLLAYERQEVEFAKLRSDIKVAQSGKILPKGLVFEASIEKGTGRKEYCKGVDAALYCLQDRDNDGSFDKVQILGGARPLPHISGRYDLEYHADESLPGWRKELVYQGAAQRVIRLTYREYGTDWSLPNVSQDLAYDQATEGVTEIVYQGAKVQLLSATSNGTRYKVVSGFRTQGPGGKR